MKDGKNASARKISGGRATTSPTASALETESARARGLGVQPSCSATSRMRRRVSGATPGPVVQREGDGTLGDAAALATSLIVGRGIPFD